MPTADGMIFRVAVRWTVQGTEEAVNVWHLRANLVVPSITDAATRLGISAWAVQAYEEITGMMSDEVVHRDISVYNTTLGYPLTPINALVALDGENTNDILPIDKAALVVHRTSVSRRLGRKYLPPFTKAAITGGRWVSSVLTALGTFATNLESPWQVDDDWEITPGVLSVAGGAFSPFVSHIVSDVPSGQDRRTPGRGS